MSLGDKYLRDLHDLWAGDVWSDAQWNASVDRLAGVAAQVDDADLRSAMCLALGRLNLDRIGTQERGLWIPVLKDWYQHQPDAVTHSASGWALRQWNVELPSGRVAVGDH